MWALVSRHYALSDEKWPSCLTLGFSIIGCSDVRGRGRVRCGCGPWGVGVGHICHIHPR